ncbi:hypothetical protein F2Q68_00022633 [Brassica cretica]|uniref:Valyl-tRNA synthetase n=1 Tax=Brassica cretica TaxID=69181 RepID=A0A8S9FW94_BRACR|nr:hypothetical protein F2Q68_00022633 [Brassica cretica]
MISLRFQPSTAGVLSASVNRAGFIKRCGLTKPRRTARFGTMAMAASPLEICVKASITTPNKLGDCPFCQRVLLTMEEKHVPYDMKMVDLSNKPEWFLKINAEGKVPVVKFDEKWVPDSDVITQALEDKYPEPPLATPPEKASVGSKIFSTFIGFLKSKDPQDGTEQVLLDELSTFNDYLKENGPYINGEKISAADLSLAPKLYHMKIALGHFKNWSVPDSLPFLKSYMENVFSRESFKNTEAQTEDVIAGWRPKTGFSLPTTTTTTTCLSPCSPHRLNTLFFTHRRRRLVSPSCFSKRRFSLCVAAASGSDVFTSPETSKSFDFASEEKIYKWWESQGYFKPSFDKGGGKPFVIPMPPPNVTGSLHMGHAMFVTLEDIMVRYNRMRGRPTLWLPGTDHAGIATQLVVEKMLASEGIKRVELGRDEFTKRVWQWKEKYGGTITNQIKRLGASCDWSRERFTLDEQLSRAVVEAFVKLHEKGLIYQGSYMVNWSPNLQTAVSDLEVEYSEEPGFLYHIKYRVAGSPDFLTIATTRPETLFGDVAIAVHPEDDRYAKYVGQTAIVPMTYGRHVPIISDKLDKEETLLSLPLPECWAVSKLHILIDSVTASYEKFFFGDVGRETYEFFWSDFADWYIEASKSRLYGSGGNSDSLVSQAVLLYVFENILKLLHPFMPFVTEDLWQALPYRKEALIVSPWPQNSLPRNVESIKRFENLQALTRAIRNVRAEYSVEPVKRISASVVGSAEVVGYISKEKEVLALLSRLDLNNVHFTNTPPEEAEEKIKLTKARLDFLKSTTSLVSQ